MIVGLLIVFGHAAGAVLLAWVYFRRVRMPRPPVGVVNRSDMLIMMAAIVLVPYVHLALPRWLVAMLLGALTIGILYATFEPLSAPRWGIWLAVLAAVVADLVCALQFGPTSAAFAFANNVVLTVAAVGVANLWAQGGMKARDVALLGGMLAVYDAVFAAWLPLMDDLLTRLAGLPFAPELFWPVGEGQWVGLGLGDILLAATFPPVIRKAFGRPAGLAAVAISLAVIAALLTTAGLGVLGASFPVMTVLGPLMVLQHVGWVHRRGRERTTREYLLAEPLPGRGA
jgi:hypothetical protein